MEMPVAGILSSRLPRVEREAGPSRNRPAPQRYLAHIHSIRLFFQIVVPVVQRIEQGFPKSTLLKQPQRHSWFAAFFAFGATMCLLTIVLLVFPGTKMDSLWNLNPEARVAFQSLGNWSILLMLAVGIGCALAAVGLWCGTLWGIRLGLAILTVNIIGDLINVVTRRDYRSLIGLPIAGAMIFYLARSTNRRRTR
jgi:hypothetical protein